MSKPIYMMFRIRPTEAYWQLSEEEQNSFWAKAREAHEKAGAKAVINLDPYWSTERGIGAGVVEFPDIDALQKFSRMLQQIGHAKYVISETMLATKRDLRVQSFLEYAQQRS